VPRSSARAIVLRAGLAGVLAVVAGLGSAQPVTTPEEARALEISTLADRDLAAAQRAVAQWLDESQTSGGRHRAFALLARAGLERRQGRYEEAIHSLEAAAALVAGEPRSFARMQSDLGVTYALAGLHGEALGAYQRALEHYEAENDWRRASAVLGNIGNSLASRGDSAAARDHYLRALAIKREHNIERGSGGLLNNLADFAMQAKDYPEAVRLLGEAARAQQAEGNPIGETIARSNLAIALAHLGRAGEALAELEHAEQLAPEGVRRLQAANLRARAEVLRLRAADRQDEPRRADLDAALAAVQAAHRLAEDMDDPARRAELLRLMSDIHAERGDWQQALRALREASEQQQAADRRVDAERYRVLAARYERERQNREIAELRELDLGRRSELERQRWAAGALAATSLALAALAFLLWRRDRERRRHGQHLAAHNQALSLALDNAESMRQRAERFAALNARLLQLAGSDLRTPLLQIRNIAERLLVERGFDASQSRQVAGIADAAGELMRIAEQMAETFELARQDNRAPPAPVDVSQLLREVAGDAQSRLLGRNRELEVDTTGPLPAPVDGARLRLALQELLNLLIDLNPATPVLRVAAERGAHSVRITLEDPSGKLMAQLGGASSDRAATTLGLLWISGALAALGGELGFDPRRHGHHVWLKLPAVDDA